MIRLQEILEVRRLGLTALVADAREDVWIRWIQVVEDEFAELIGGELVVTTGRWHRAPADSDRFLAALTRQGVAALAVSPWRSGGIPHDLISACARARMPLLQIPGGVSCEAVCEFVTTLIVDRRGVALVDTLSRQRALAAAMTDERAAPVGILDVLQQETPHRMWLFTPGAPLVPANAPEPSADDLAAVAAAVATQPAAREVAARGGRSSLFPVGAGGGRRRAHLVVSAPADDIPGALREAIEQAILFLRARFDARERLRVFHRRCEDELMRWIASDETARGSVDGWVKALGIEPAGHVLCLVVRTLQAEIVRDALDDMADALEMQRITVTGDGDVGVALFAHERAQEAERSISRLRLILSADPTTRDLVDGTSSVIATDVADVTRAFLDARQVCRLNELRHPEPEDEHQPQQPLSALLLQGDGNALGSLHAAVLSPLLAYDEEHSSDLVLSLDVFLSSNGQWVASAAELGIHVNTLRYRMRRIEEITGRDLGSMADRVDFYVALRSARSPATRTAH